MRSKESTGLNERLELNTKKTDRQTDRDRQTAQIYLGFGAQVSVAEEMNEAYKEALFFFPLSWDGSAWAG